MQPDVVNCNQDLMLEYPLVAQIGGAAPARGRIMHRVEIPIGSTNPLEYALRYV